MWRWGLGKPGGGSVHWEEWAWGLAVLGYTQPMSWCELRREPWSTCRSPPQALQELLPLAWAPGCRCTHSGREAGLCALVLFSPS